MANELFSSLGIGDEPIRSFSELERSASSMVVAIYERLFSRRLAGIVRHPERVTDYIDNAGLILAELTRIMEVDELVTPEGIYAGDPYQVEYMLQIFMDILEETRLEEGSYSEMSLTSQDQHELHLDVGDTSEEGRGALK